MRYALAVLVVGGLLVAAWALYDSTAEERRCVDPNYFNRTCRGYDIEPRPDWSTPAALMLAVVGIAAGVGIVATRRT
jgi:hypothetical protein